MGDCLRVKEVAERLAVSEQTVRNMVKDGTLQCVRIGKRGIRIPRAAVEAFMNEKRKDV